MQTATHIHIYTHETDSWAFVMAIKAVCFKHTLLIKSQLKCHRRRGNEWKGEEGKNAEGVNVREGRR